MTGHNYGSATEAAIEEMCERLRLPPGRGGAGGNERDSPEGLFGLAMEILSEGGLEHLADAMKLVLNAAMLFERERHLGAAPYERSAERQGHANGFKPRTVRTRAGEMQLSIPQVRDSSFYPSALEKGIRSERALTAALAEMYVQGVSTRKVAAITEKLCGFEVTSSQVSRATARLDEALSAWRERPLGRCPYVFLDARYEKVRDNGVVRDAAVLIALGVDGSGHREVLGVSMALSEQEAHWREFLKSLQARGLTGVELFVSDDHCGLKAARKAVFPSVTWQRCQFHLQQNASSYVPKQEMKAQVAADIRAIFQASGLGSARELLAKAVKQYEESAPRLARWMETNLEEGLAVFNFPQAHQKFIRTTNVLERLNKEIKRRTRVVGVFPNEASGLRLITAVVMETSEDWQSGKVYITFPNGTST